MIDRAFVDRHIGPNNKQINHMLSELKLSSLTDLVEKATPKSIRNVTQLDLPKAQSEHEFLSKAKLISEKNKIFKNYIGLGYYSCYTPCLLYTSPSPRDRG